MTTGQNVLVIGSGGREHALAWKISHSPKISRLFVAPGNPGTALLGTNVAIKATDFPALVRFAQKNKIDLTVVGPDNALAEGIVDAFNKAGLRIYGPTKAAARIESSKAFSKALMKNKGVPTAGFEIFTDAALARNYAVKRPLPVVIKASGLALGKGVYICHTRDDINQAITDIMDSRLFGESGSEVVIEDYLLGREVSVHAFCDGKTAVLFPPAQDHKQIGTGDIGPNTGGMGVISPLRWVKPETMSIVMSKVVDPIMKGLEDAGSPFVGTLYPGLMISERTINVLEYNARFGDPETQSYMRLLDTDLLEILNACVDGTLAGINIKWSTKYCVNVVLASGGYPGAYSKDSRITGLSAAEQLPDVVVFHAGTATNDGEVVTAGGRVLSVSAIGDSPKEAQSRAYAAARLIRFDGVQYRTDIGAKSL
jgi:phosphoribosylamine--glycine ligase